MTSRNIARANHSVPRDYLRQWSGDTVHVSGYRLLVPHERFPRWEQYKIRSLTVYRDLYTSVGAGEDSDVAEQWLNTEIESPAAPALEKVQREELLSDAEMRTLVRYLAAMDRRTPAAFVEQKELSERTLPDVMERTMARIAGVLRQPRHVRRRIVRPHRADESLIAPPIRVKIERDSARGGGVVRAEVTSGRELWLSTLQRTLTETVKVLYRHQWTILRPTPGSSWYTSDHPVVRLNYYGDEHYDFRGGWGSTGTEIFFPVSPRHLLYTRIGHEWSGDRTLSPELTLVLQRFIAERAHRWIFAHGMPRRAEMFRPRRVDLAAFDAEDRSWRDFHRMQTAAEKSDEGE